MNRVLHAISMTLSSCSAKIDTATSCPTARSAPLGKASLSAALVSSLAVGQNCVRWQRIPPSQRPRTSKTGDLPGRTASGGRPGLASSGWSRELPDRPLVAGATAALAFLRPTSRICLRTHSDGLIRPTPG